VSKETVEEMLAWMRKKHCECDPDTGHICVTCNLLDDVITERKQFARMKEVTKKVLNAIMSYPLYIYQNGKTGWRCSVCGRSDRNPNTMKHNDGCAYAEAILIINPKDIK